MDPGGSWLGWNDQNRLSKPIGVGLQSRIGAALTTRPNWSTSGHDEAMELHEAVRKRRFTTHAAMHLSEDRKRHASHGGGNGKGLTTHLGGDGEWFRDSVEYRIMILIGHTPLRTAQ